MKNFNKLLAVLLAGLMLLSLAACGGKDDKVIPSILTFGIGAFFLSPYLNAANAEFYVELKNKQA